MTAADSRPPSETGGMPRRGGIAVIDVAVAIGVSAVLLPPVVQGMGALDAGRTARLVADIQTPRSARPAPPPPPPAPGPRRSQRPPCAARSPSRAGPGAIAGGRPGGRAASPI